MVIIEKTKKNEEIAFFSMGIKKNKLINIL